VISIEDSIFISRCKTAIEMMREEDMNETRIACVLTEIRSAALSQHFTKVRELIEANPPKHLSHGEMMNLIKEYES